MGNFTRMVNRIVIGIFLFALLMAGVIVVVRAAEDAAQESLLAEDPDGKITESELDMEDMISISIKDGQARYSCGGQDLTGEQAEESGLSFDGTVLEISAAGSYRLSGSLNGQISVTSSKKEEVVLLLDGLQVVNETGAALEVKKTGSLLLMLAEGSGNVLTSGVPTKIEETETGAEDAQDASGGALYSKADTVIAGEGSLTVNGYNNNGIQCTKDLTVQSGTITVQAVHHAIKGKDHVVIEGGQLTLLAGGDGIHAEQEAQEEAARVVDETTGEILSEAQEAKEAAGEVEINGGVLQINCYGDGIQALLALTVNDGEIQIKTERESELAPQQTGSRREGDSFGGSDGNPDKTDTSQKGLKSDGSLTINKGKIILDCTDDALHCAALLTVNGGEITLSSKDDGIHSDERVVINDGDICILGAYEGIEANQIDVAGGSISMTTSDDGFNANGGPASFGGPGGQASKDNKSTQMPNLNISGGTIYVNALGDGLDSNGNISVTGGLTIVDGPRNSGNGAIDSGMENGGEILISDGTVFAGGASGMAETFGAASTQCSFHITFPLYYPEGTVIDLIDAQGTSLFTHTTQGSGNCVVFSCPELAAGETYTLKIGEYTLSIPVTDTVTRLTVTKDGTVEESKAPGASGGGPAGPGRR